MSDEALTAEGGLMRDPGLYADVPMSEYHTWPGASQSRLKTLRDKSPLHLRYEMDHPSESTPTQALGEAVHVAVLQPDLFALDYVRAPEGDRRTKAVKSAWADLASDCPDSTILKPDDYDLCAVLRDTIAAHPKASRLLEGDAERSAVWDDATGVRCRGRFDLISDRAPVIVDLKTTRDASPDAFGRAIYTYGYYIQGAHYRRGGQALGLEIEHFVIIAIEKVPPYALAVYDITGDALRAGEEELDVLLARYAECEQSGVWPGYGGVTGNVAPISLPPWAWRQIDERTGNRE